MWETFYLVCQAEEKRVKEDGEYHTHRVCLEEKPEKLLNVLAGLLLYNQTTLQRQPEEEASTFSAPHRRPVDSPRQMLSVSLYNPEEGGALPNTGMIASLMVPFILKVPLRSVRTGYRILLGPGEWWVQFHSGPLGGASLAHLSHQTLLRYYINLTTTSRNRFQFH